MQPQTCSSQPIRCSNSSKTMDIVELAELKLRDLVEAGNLEAIRLAISLKRTSRELINSDSFPCPCDPLT